MRPPTTEDYLWGLNVLLNVWVGLQGFRSGLARQFPWFHIFLLVSAAISLVLFYFRSIAPNMDSYALIYSVWGYCAPAFYFLFVSEINKAVLNRFPAIELASRRVLRFIWLGLAVVVTGWFVYLTQGSNLPFQRLKAALSYQQAATTGFALFLLCFLGFITFMPVPLSRIRLLQCFLLGGFFISLAISRLIALLNDFRWARLAGSYVGIVGTILVLIAWAIWMKNEPDETVLRTPGRTLDRDEAAAYMERLAQLNDSLTRSGPRILR